MNEGVLAAVGSTPLVRLDRIFKSRQLEFFAKLEQCNPGGSVKDRPALHIISHALNSGIIQPDTIIIESSSGNMGIGLAQVCCYYKLRFICVIDPKTTGQNIAILRAYGAEIDMVDRTDTQTGDYLPARLKRVKELITFFPNSFWPNQYNNLQNAQAHYLTMEEINREVGKDINFLFCSTSTCGTLRGCSEYVRAHNLPTKIVAIDAVGSVIFGNERTERLIPGHGAAVIPGLFQSELADYVIHVSDLECVIGCRRLVYEEALLSGGSSGAIIAGVMKLDASITKGSVCVAIFPDRGERYLETIYCDEWVTKHFGRVVL